MRSKKSENMGEIKSVKVDNWGVFFLQKLQNFFNKTDYCDLTLQFNDNSQLKVHRLVLNACTDYFNVLEQTCEMIDDVLIMPNELQADLVVPIVNFMYTGTLEFELKIYGKLLKTARDMNMTVLLKLLEAHRRTMETKPKNQKTSPKQSGFTPTKAPLPGNNKSIPQKNTNRPIIANSESIYKTLQIKPFSSTNYKSGSILSKPQSKTVQVKGPTRFEYEGSDSLSTFDSTFDNISYESKPLKVEYEEQYSQSEASPFEQLRQTGYNNNKRPAQSILESPPTKKPNIQDVKEYAEQQRMRKQIAEEYGEEPDFDSILDDEFHNNDDDEEFSNIQESTRPTTSKQSLAQNTSHQKQQTSLRKSSDSSTQHKPTIVVKECSSSNVDHAKIISEVLRKYPHLIKNNKNIKLKIMPTTSGSGTQKVVIKKEPDEQRTIVPTVVKTEPISPRKISQAVPISLTKTETPPLGNRVSPGSIQKPDELSGISTPNQPRRIDSKTMKQLIALGAENTTGPWLCLRCGVNGRPISIPSYRGFRRHLVNTHKEKIDPRLCEHCGWRSINQKELAFHMYTQHEVRTSISFPKCEHCGTVVYDLQALDQHIDDVHPEVKEDNQQCIYCNKTFSTELMLYNHMKDQHKERARDDGVIDFSEEDEAYEEYEQKIHGIDDSKSGSKIQILSDIDLPKCISLTQITKPGGNTEFDHENLVEMLGGSSQIMQPTDLITSVSAPISNEPKFINADGNVMELTPAQRAEIMSQLEQGGDGVVMVLDESFSEPVPTKIVGNIEDEVSQESQLTTENESDHNMVLMNNLVEDVGEHVEEQVMEEEAVHDSNEEKITQEADDLEEQLSVWKPVETDSKSNKEDKEDSLRSTSEMDETAESLDEQLEKLTQMTQPIIETKKTEKVSKDELDERLKMLTNDWTDDEEDGENSQANQANSSDKSEQEKGEPIKKNEVEKKSETSENENNKLDEGENIEDILQDGLENKDETEINNSDDSKKIEEEEEETTKEETEISKELTEKDLDNTQESVDQHDPEDSEDEEKVMREQPICETEEDAPMDNNTLNSETEIEDQSKQIDKNNEKDDETIKKQNECNKLNDEDPPIKSEEKNKIEDKDLNILLEDDIKNEKEIEEPIKSEPEEDEERNRRTSTESKKDDTTSTEKPLDTKKDEIKNILNEWDEENDEDL